MTTQWSSNLALGRRQVESPNGTDVLTVGPVINASPVPGSPGSGNTLAISSSGQITLHGAVLGGSSVIELYYTNHTAYQQNSAGSWFGPITSSGTGASVANPKTGTASANGTIVTTVGPTITTGNGEVFALTSGAQVSVGGVTDSTSSNVVAILYWNSRVYRKSGANQASASASYNYDWYDWYWKTVSANAWSGAVCDPRLPLPTTFLNITASPYNCVGDGTTDNQTALQNAFNDGAAQGKAVFVPAGNFAHSNTLSISGITVFGTGNASILTATNNSLSAVELVGTGSFLTCLRINCPNTARLFAFECAGVFANVPTSSCLQNVVIFGSGSPAVFSHTSTYGIVQYNSAISCWSDSITQVDQTAYCTLNGNRIYNSGDDNISNNSYTDNPGPVNNIVITNNSAVLQNNARCYEISGGDNITYNSNFAVQNSAVNPFAGFLAATESSSYQTLGVNNCGFINNCLVNAGGNQSAIFLWAQNTAYSISNIKLQNNQLINNTGSPIQLQDGAPITGTISNTTIYESVTTNPTVNNVNATNVGGLSITGTSTNTLASWNGVYSVPPAGGCGWGGANGSGGVPGATSPQGWVVNQASAREGYAVTDASLNAFSINGSAQITVNGSILAGTSNVIFLLYWGGSVYQMNSSKAWFGPVTTTSGGSAVADPRT